MFSTGEFEYIKGLTENYYNNGYQQYLCITNNPVDYSNNNVYDIVCYYSKNNLTITNNNLSVTNNSVKCEFDSNNYSNNNTIDKLVCNNYNGNVELNKKEFIYSNIVGYSDIINERKYVEEEKLIGLSIMSVLIILMLYQFVSRIIRG